MSRGLYWLRPSKKAIPFIWSRNGVEVDKAELFPLGQEGDGVGAFGRVESSLHQMILGILQEFAGIGHRDGIEEAKVAP